MLRFNEAKQEVLKNIREGRLNVTYTYLRQSEVIVRYEAAAKAMFALHEVDPGHDGLIQAREAFTEGLAYIKGESHRVRGMNLLAFVPSDPDFAPHRYGGKTICEIGNVETVGYGVSICLPEDEYFESAGRDLSFNYALHEAAKSAFRAWM